MKAADRFCSLLFDEVSWSQGFHYEKMKQYISGYEDLGSIGRTNKEALVFMVARSWLKCSAPFVIKGPQIVLH